MLVGRRWWLGAALFVCGCARSGGTVDLMPPFSDDTVVGQLSVRWTDSGETRATGGADGTRRRVEFRIQAENLLSDRLYLRIRELRLIARDGTAVTGDADAACALAPRATAVILTGSVWVPSADANAIRGFRVDPLAVPLSERGRAFYREFLLRQRPDAAAQIDAELAAYASAPPCGAS